MSITDVLALVCHGLATFPLNIVIIDTKQAPVKIQTVIYFTFQSDL
jgi:hypothetical protein